MAMTTNKGYELIATGTEDNTWGDTLNASVFNRIDQNLGSVTSKTLSNVDVTLSTAESRTLQVVLTGALSGDVVITTPGIGFYIFRNYTTGLFKVTLQYTGGVGAVVILPQGCAREIAIDPTNGCFAVGLDMPGTLKPFAAGATALPPSLTGEYLLCDGSAVSRSTYAQLFNIVGTTYGPGNGTTTFNVPDYRGRGMFGRDNMGGSAAGRITSGGSGIDGTTLGAAGGAQTVPVLQANLPNVTWPQTLAISGDQTGGITRNFSFAFGQVETGSGANRVNNIIFEETTLSLSGSVTSGGSGTEVNKVPPAMICNIMIKT